MSDPIAESSKPFLFEELMGRLSHHGKTKPSLVSTMVELTYGCNLRCVHCYNPTHEAKNELSTSQVFRILDQLAEEGTLQVGFTGGELFTRQDIFEILRYAKSKGFVISIFTNATMITADLADRIKESGPFEIEISVYGATAEVYEKVTRVPGSFARFVRGVDLLKERGIPMALKLVLMTLNVHEFEAMRQFAISRGAPFKFNTEIYPRVDGSREPLAYRLSPQKSFEIWREKSGKGIREAREKKPASLLHQEKECDAATGLFDCMCGKSNAAVTPYGKMNLCVSAYTPQYDLTEGTVAEGWKQLVDLVASAHPGPDYECGDCALAKQCVRGPNHGWLEHGRFDGPCIPRFLEEAQLKTEFLEENSLGGIP